MELKNYQKRVLHELDAYISLLNSTKNLNTAYNEHWHALGISIGLGHNTLPPYNDVLSGVPHVCFKVPTGGGKTLLACASIKHIFDGIGALNTKAVVWLVPSTAILEQTIAHLRDPQDPYRQQINFDFGARVEVYDGTQALNGQALSPSSVRENLSIFVLTYDSLRITRKEGRKIYQENGNLAPFVAHYTDRDALVPSVDETALIQVINQLSPVVIVDESHNAQSDLSVEMLHNLNPSFVLDLTATPKSNSNIISIVDARELKKENMVKLPVIIYNRRTKSDVLLDALQLQSSLEKEARLEAEQTGSYVRPIVLFQAQPKGKDSATTFEQLRNELIKIGVPKEQIAIKTSEINELKNIKLLSPACPIRYIITVNALKEGWDCSFAYILATLANRTSKVDVEQIVGRVLRLPYARKHARPLLNMAYVMTCSADFRETVESVVKGLNRAGFSEKDYRIGEDAPEEPVAPPVQQTVEDIPPQNLSDDQEEFLGFDTQALRERFQAQVQNPDAMATASTAISQMMDEAEQRGAAFDEEIRQAEEAGIPLTGGNDMRKFYEMQPEYADVLDLRLPIFMEDIGASLLFDHDHQPVTKESLADGFTLADKDTQITFSPSQNNVTMLDLDSNKGLPRYIPLSEKSVQAYTLLIQSYPPDKKKEMCRDLLYAQLNRMDSVGASDLKKYIERIVEPMSSDDLARMESNPFLYADAIKSKINGMIDDYREKQFIAKIESGEIIVEPQYRFPKSISPTSTMLPINKSLYEQEADVNNFEHRVITEIASLPNVRWWHRVIDSNKASFVLNGFINHYPDFIVATTSGKIVLVETKGDDRDNSDSRIKLQLGRKWADMAGAKYRYYMVFDENDTGFDGAYPVREFMELMKRL